MHAEEGEFYLWTEAELIRVLGETDVAALKDAVFALPEPGSLQQILARLRPDPTRHGVH